ncbi:MAG: S9 family peptidase [Deltaproteobacteria bacterium]|nr:S9 family peptidase [Deltaproteobacteria bacterium]
MLFVLLIAALSPPVAKIVPHGQTVHGLVLKDDYFWMRNKGKKDVVAHLEAENAYARAMMKPAAALEQKLHEEMRARVEEDSQSPPVRIKDWLYYRREEKGKQYPIWCRKKEGGPEIVTLDVNALAKGEKFIDVEGTLPSDDGHLLAYFVDTKGFRQYVLKIKDLRTGKLSSEAIERATALAFAKDNKTMFYVTEDPQTKRPNKLFRHTLGAAQKSDVLVYEEKDEMFDLDVERSRSGDYAFVTSASRTTSEVRLIDAGAPTAEMRIVAPRKQDHEYYVDHGGDTFYVRTNDTGRNFRLVTAPVNEPSKWTELVAHRPDVMLEEVLALQSHLVRFEREGGLAQIVITDLKTQKSGRVKHGEPLFDVFAGWNPEFTTDEVRYSFTSLKTPFTFMAAPLAKLGEETKVLKQKQVPTYDAAKYETRRVAVTARDGTKIPVSLLYRAGTQPDATQAMLLDGYGAYGFPNPVAFDPQVISLVDRGFVYAIAHIRGGGELGKRWHDDGRMMKKMNTFTDFIDAAEAMKKDKWVAPDKLVITGGSAGGLLMGAVLNMRPDLFRAALVYVPFVDVINTMLDETLPLTVNEFEEWGNPKQKPAFDYMAQYSPYDNVAKKDYPATLVVSAYNDSQVMYWEPAKWVAKLRAQKTDKNPLLFKINMQPAGHGGVSGRYDRIKDAAFEYAFVVQAVSSQPSDVSSQLKP